MRSRRFLETRRGTIQFPAYIPVTTYGGKYPLDDLIRPYLSRLAPAVMVSHHYAQTMKNPPRVPLLIDSGGFAALFENSRVVERRGLGVLETDSTDGETSVLDPKSVLEFQEEHADVAFTLDFPIPPGLDVAEAKKRQYLTIANALWAIKNRRRKDLKLYACVQAWDPGSAHDCACQYAGTAFDGVGIGGLVPRVRRLDLIHDMVAAVREVVPDLPLHVFGLGKPEVVAQLFDWGVDSVDSSAYVRAAADGKAWDVSEVPVNCATHDRLFLALRNVAFAANKLPLAWQYRKEENNSQQLLPF